MKFPRCHVWHWKRSIVLQIRNWCAREFVLESKGRKRTPWQRPGSSQVTHWILHFSTDTFKRAFKRLAAGVYLNEKTSSWVWCSSTQVLFVSRSLARGDGEQETVRGSTKQWCQLLLAWMKVSRCRKWDLCHNFLLFTVLHVRSAKTGVTFPILEMAQILPRSERFWHPDTMEIYMDIYTQWRYIMEITYLQ